MKNPCWQCPKREIGCHSKCGDYLLFHQEREMIRQRRHMIGELHGMSRELVKNLRRKSLQAR